MSAAFKFDAVTGTYVIGAPPGQKLTEPANHQAVQALIGQLDQLGIVDHSKPIADPITATQDLGCLTGSPDPAKCSGAPLNVLK